MKNLFRPVRTNLLVGLLLVFPLAVTFFVIRWLFNLTTNIFIGLVPKGFLGVEYQPIWRLIVFVLMLFALFLLGAVVRNMVGKRLYNAADRLLARVPVVNKIYVGTRQMMEVMFSTSKTKAMEAVFVEYPRMGVYSLGFVTARVPPETKTVMKLAHPEDEWLSVFIPTTPNPTSGWFCVVPRSATTPAGMSNSEAMKLVISGGAVYPGYVQEAEGPSLLDMIHGWVARKDHDETPAPPAQIGPPKADGQPPAGPPP
jgi:uncharacterized membrane protein